MTVLWILLILFGALMIIVPLIEKRGPKVSPEQLNKLSRWFLPLVGLTIILSLVAHFMR